MVFIGQPSGMQMNFEAALEPEPASVSPRSRLAAFQQLAASLHLPEEHKGFNAAALPTNFGSFGHAKDDGLAIRMTKVKACDGQAASSSTPGSNLLNPPAPEGRPRTPSPCKQTALAKRLPKSLPHLILPAPCYPDSMWSAAAPAAACTAPVTMPAATTSVLGKCADGSYQLKAQVMEVKGKNHQSAEAMLKDDHLFLFQEGEQLPYRIENLQHSVACQQAENIVQIDGPFCVQAKVKFEDATAAQQWIVALRRAAEHVHGAASPANNVDKSGTLVKVKDTVFGNRTVTARLVDDHLQLYSSATSRAPYRIEDLHGASVRIADACFFLEGPYCLPGIYKAGNPEQAKEWVEAIQRAANPAQQPKPKAKVNVPLYQDDAVFHAQLAQQLKLLQEVAAAVPAAKRADTLERISKFQAQLMSELNAQATMPRKAEPTFCLAPGGVRRASREHLL